MFTIEQVTVSLLANAVGLSIVLLLRSAPPRVVLYVCIASMLAIIFPWIPFIEGEMASYVRLDILEIGSQSLSTFVALPVTHSDSFGSIIIALWLSIGFVWAAYTIVQSSLTRRKWRSLASCGKSLAEHANTVFTKELRRTSIRRLPSTSLVFSTGYFRPEIWIGEHVRKDAQVRVALNHELCHIASNDQLTLFLIVVVERLLWWNPLIWLLGRQARRQMEYACDCRCQSLLGKTKYRQSLAELLLGHEPGKAALAIPLINRSGIISRMERIGMNYSLKKKHVFILVMGATLIAAVGTNLAAQGIKDGPSLVQCHELLPKEVQYALKITSDIDTREGREGSIRMTLVDATKPDSEDDDIPEGAGEFLKCLQKVIGVGDDEGWPEV